MIGFIGDIHGEFWYLDLLAEKLQENNVNEFVYLVQVGDFGFYPKHLSNLPKMFPYPVFVIDGNHEDFVYLGKFPQDKTTEFAPNFHYVPRGLTLEIDGVKLGFMGGAASIDKALRTPGVSWFAEELITQADFEKLYNYDGELDILVTHTPSQRMISGHFPPLNKREWGLAPDWYDPSAIYIERLVEKFANAQVISGHMHRSVVDGRERILNIGEVYWYTKR